MKRLIKFFFQRAKLLTVFFLAVIICCAACAHENRLIIMENGSVSNSKADNPANPFIYPVEFYRKYISTVVGSRCPMYPTCSKYCIDALKKHGPVVGYIMTCDRLMRCGRDEVRLSPTVWINGEKRCYDPVSNNDFWW
jgi:putative membrane protein insertion efficiency factor